MAPTAAAQHYAAALHRSRIERNWSRRELAQRSGISINTISRLETAEREPRLGQIIGLACVLERPASSFILDEAQR